MVSTFYSAFGQSDFPYQTPDKAILDLADAKPVPVIRLNDDATLGLLLTRTSYKSIEELSQPELKLAGLRINPANNGPSRVGYFYGIKILDVKANKELEVVGLPANPLISNLQWSRDQLYAAFTITEPTQITLWVIDIAKRSAKKLSNRAMNLNMNFGFAWYPDSKRLLINTIVNEDFDYKQSINQVPTGPIISENDGQKAQNRTYQDLLKSPQDEKLFESLVTSAVYSIDLDGNEKKVAKEAMHAGVSFSPDGLYLLSYTIQYPFSYIVNYDRFPMKVNLLNNSFEVVKTVVEVPLIEELPKGFMAVRKGMRSLQWRADRPSTLVYVEALDGGDPAVEVPFRDAIYIQKVPMVGDPVKLFATKERYAGITWGNDEIAVVRESWWNTRNERHIVINPSKPSNEGRLFSERNQQDSYSDKGSFVTNRNNYGQFVLDLEDNQFTLIGNGFQKEGKFPFIDQYSIKDFATKRIYQSTSTAVLEDVQDKIENGKDMYLTRIESKTDYPNFYLLNAKTKVSKQITFFENPFKILATVYKEVINYTRPDGVELSANLYLPVDYDTLRKEKLPMIMWAYPTEFKDKSTAGQVTANPNEFIFPYYGSPLYWLTRGYIVLDDAAFPILGEGKNEPNDTFIPQLVANAKAAIDKVNELGYIDPKKVAVGGHSYGAFMTANLLTHSDLFAAGIARSGAYNRTLTPFGFQSEERNYWEAHEVYDAMSPFQNADKMKTPLLIIHGEADNNSGTFPMQSERYFNALKGLGATTRLVILPKESHGYSAKESIMHLLWEQDRWLEKYVKNKPDETKP